MKIAVVIPWRETPSRLPLKEYLDKWYRSNFPQAKIVYGDSDHEMFNASAARNDGTMQVLDYDIVIYNDADTIPEIKTLQEGIEKTLETGLFCNPYDTYRLLDEENTKRVLEGSISYAESDYKQVHEACSGVLITTPSGWDAIGGYDERFLSWGYEDWAIREAHKTILGSDFLVIPGNVYAMSHVINETLDNLELRDKVLELYNKYLDASEDKNLMLELIDGNRPWKK